MSLPPNILMLPDRPAFTETALLDFRQTLMAEAVSMARYGDDLTVEKWRAWGEDLLASFAWPSDERRKAFANRLASIVREAQVRREEARASLDDDGCPKEDPSCDGPDDGCHEACERGEVAP